WRRATLREIVSKAAGAGAAALSSRREARAEDAQTGLDHQLVAVGHLLAQTDVETERSGQKADAGGQVCGLQRRVVDQAGAQRIAVLAVAALQEVLEPTAVAPGGAILGQIEVPH